MVANFEILGSDSGGMHCTETKPAKLGYNMPAFRRGLSPWGHNRPRSQERLFATRKMMGITAIPNFDIYSAAKKRDGKDPIEKGKKNAEIRVGD